MSWLANTQITCRSIARRKSTPGKGSRSIARPWRIGLAVRHSRCGRVHARLLEQLKQSTKLFADETRAPVLDPGRGETKKGQFWAYARDERPWKGTAPPGVAYVYEPDRKHARPAQHLAGFRGILQVDGYGAYTDLAQAGDVVLAFCWSHSRRKFYDIQ